MARAWILLCLTSLAATGCSGGVSGPPYVNATGIVTLDGKPIEGATVTFSPKKDGSMSMGLTDAEGRFVLKSATGRKGAAVGEHNVSIALRIDLGPAQPAASEEDLAPPQSFEINGGTAPPPKPTTKWIIPEKYSDPTKSGLDVTVPSGGLTDHKFELKSK